MTNTMSFRNNTKICYLKSSVHGAALCSPTVPTFTVSSTMIMTKVVIIVTAYTLCVSPKNRVPTPARHVRRRSAYLFLLQHRLPVGLFRGGWWPWLSVMATEEKAVNPRAGSRWLFAFAPLGTTWSGSRCVVAKW